MYRTVRLRRITFPLHLYYWIFLTVCRLQWLPSVKLGKRTTREISSRDIQKLTNQGGWCWHLTGNWARAPGGGGVWQVAEKVWALS